MTSFVHHRKLHQQCSLPFEEYIRDSQVTLHTNDADKIPADQLIDQFLADFD